MPTYSYRCADCDNAFDIYQAFSDDTLTICPECGGTLRKQFNTIGVTFNGSGFYRTDSRAGGSDSSGSGSSESGTSAGTDTGAGSSSSGSSPSTGSTGSGRSSSGPSGSKGTGASAASAPAAKSA